jgi:hypothetical protein
MVNEKNRPPYHGGLPVLLLADAGRMPARMRMVGPQQPPVAIIRQGPRSQPI